MTVLTLIPPLLRLRRPRFVVAGWLVLAAGLSTPPVVAQEAPATPPAVTSWDEYWSYPSRETGPGTLSLDLKAHVAYFDPVWRLLWIHDGHRAGYVLGDWTDLNITAGGYYRITGEIPLPAAELSLRNAHLEPLPPAPIPTLVAEDLTNYPRLRDQFVQIEGLVENQLRADESHLQLTVTAQGHTFDAWVIAIADGVDYRWTGSFVRLTGVYNPKVAPAGEFLSLELMVPDPDHVEFVSRLDSDPRFDRDATPLNRLAQADPAALVRLSGEVVKQTPGQSLTLRDDTGQALVHTGQIQPFAAGTLVEAIGFPRANGLELHLDHAFVRPVPTADTASVSNSNTVPLVFTLAARVLALAPDVANEKRPVELDGVITWSHPDSRYLYLQDSSGGIGVYLGKNRSAVPAVGSHVTLHGTTGLGEFAPVVVAERFEVTGTLELPVPLPITLDAANTGVYEAQWVELTGYLHRTLSAANWTQLHVSTADGEFRALLPKTDAFDDQVGAIVRLRGVCSAVTDRRGRVTHIQLWTPSAAQLEIKEPVPADPFSLPAVPLAEFGRFGTADYFQRHVRVTGTVLLSTRGPIVLIQQGDFTLRLIRRSQTPLAAGDRVEAVGLPARREGHFAVREARIRVVGAGAPPPGLRLDEPRILKPEIEDRRVTVEAELIETGSFGGAVHLTLRSDDAVFEAQLRDTPADAVSAFPLGARLRITGIYTLQSNDLGDPAGFHLAVDGPNSIAILSVPSWWTEDRMTKVCALLALTNLVALWWALRLRRRGRRTDR